MSKSIADPTHVAAAAAASAFIRAIEAAALAAVADDPITAVRFALLASELRQKVPL
jgi:hypothetical protein